MIKIAVIILILIILFIDKIYDCLKYIFNKKFKLQVVIPIGEVNWYIFYSNSWGIYWDVLPEYNKDYNKLLDYFRNKSLYGESNVVEFAKTLKNAKEVKKYVKEQKQLLKEKKPKPYIINIR